MNTVCGSLTYIYTKSNSVNAFATTDPYYSKTDTPTITISSSTSSLIGTSEVLTMRGYNANYGTTYAETTLTVYFVSNCDVATVTATSVSSISYTILTDSSKSVTFTDFSTSISGCGSLTYTLVSADSSFVSIDSSTRTITVSTTSSSKVGSYSYNVQGCLASYPSVCATTPISITIL